MEVQSVKVQENVLRVRVWVKTAEDLGYFLQTDGQAVVRPGGETLAPMLDQRSNIDGKYYKFWELI